ncbi:MULTISPECIES: hypothetical protein [unclassified Microcoleus]|uniref:hypothetical protein n=1 Tax=unclassified Microcoleus TaxID=2642155 RepID=UPI0025CD3EEE|nr:MULTISPECIES: hypothetical protein [unclassified Microcoleus]
MGLFAAAKSRNFPAAIRDVKLCREASQAFGVERECRPIETGVISEHAASVDTS